MKKDGFQGIIGTSVLLFILFSIELTRTIAWIITAIVIIVVLFLIFDKLHYNKLRRDKRITSEFKMNGKHYVVYGERKDYFRHVENKRSEEANYMLDYNEHCKKDKVNVLFNENTSICPSCGMVVDPISSHCRCSK